MSQITIPCTPSTTVLHDIPAGISSFSVLRPHPTNEYRNCSSTLPVKREAPKPQIRPPSKAYRVDLPILTSPETKRADKTRRNTLAARKSRARKLALIAALTAEVEWWRQKFPYVVMPEQAIDESGAPPLPPPTVSDTEESHKRARNTLAARDCRKRQRARLRALTNEAEWWRERYPGVVMPEQTDPVTEPFANWDMREDCYQADNEALAVEVEMWGRKYGGNEHPLEFKQFERAKVDRYAGAPASGQKRKRGKKPKGTSKGMVAEIAAAGAEEFVEGEVMSRKKRKVSVATAEWVEFDEVSYEWATPYDELLLRRGVEKEMEAIPGGSLDGPDSFGDSCTLL